MSSAIELVNLNELAGIPEPTVREAVQAVMQARKRADEARRESSGGNRRVVEWQSQQKQRLFEAATQGKTIDEMWDAEARPPYDNSFAYLVAQAYEKTLPRLEADLMGALLANKSAVQEYLGNDADYIYKTIEKALAGA